VRDRLALPLAVAAFACLTASVWTGGAWPPAHLFCHAAGSVTGLRDGCWDAPAWSKALGLAAVVLGIAAAAAWLASGLGARRQAP
jgi:hypothetical protein